MKQRQQGLSEKLDQTRDSLNQRMDDMMKNMDKRFESIGILLVIREST